jgi:hypothetical protein
MNMFFKILALRRHIMTYPMTFILLFVAVNILHLSLLGGKKQDFQGWNETLASPFMVFFLISLLGMNTSIIRVIFMSIVAVIILRLMLNVTPDRISYGFYQRAFGSKDKMIHFSAYIALTCACFQWFAVNCFNNWFANINLLVICGVSYWVGHHRLKPVDDTQEV